MLFRSFTFFVVCTLGVFSCAGFGDGEACSRYYSSGDDVEQVLVVGDTAYLASGSDGLHIIDISKPMSIDLLSVIPTTNGTMSVSVENGIAYIADGYNGLRCFDVNDPSNPVLLGDYIIPDQFVNYVVVRSGIAYIIDSFPTTSNLGLVMLDVSDPSSVSFLGSYSTAGFPRSLLLHGDLALVPDAHHGLQIIDVSDPTNPALVSTIANIGPGWTNAVAASGSTVYVGEDAGIVVYDISDPQLAVQIGLLSQSTGFGTGDLFIDGDTLYVAILSNNWNVLVVEVFSPSNPYVIESISFPTPGHIGSLSIDNGIMFLGTRELGWVDADPDKYMGESGLMALSMDSAGCKDCPADLNSDGLYNFFDVSAFLSAFGVGDSAADFTGDGVFNFFDVSAFLSAFGAGCP